MGLRDLFFAITASDKTGGAFGSVNRNLRTTEGLSASVSERLGRAGGAMQRFGARGSVASAGVVAVFRDSLSLFDQQERAETKVAQAIKTTGGAAGFTADELFRQASALQAVTRFGDEDILGNVTAQLLTFTNVSGTAFERAQELVLDFVATTGRGALDTSIQFGKALNDPVKGLTALSRAGIQFSDAQKDLIKDMVAVGDVAGAQALILDELETQYGGQARAAREAGTGVVDAFSNSFGDLKEIVGGVFLQDVLPPIVDGMQSVVTSFQTLDEPTQRFITLIGLAAVAVPPLTAALGLLVSGMAALGGPVTLAIAGVAAITAGVVAFWPEQENAAKATDQLTGALGDEITQSQLLSGVLGGSTTMSVDAARKKLSEARARQENVKAIIAENRALKLQSTDYQALLSDISDTEDALNSLGFPAIDAATPINAEAFEQTQKRLADLRVQQQDFLKAGEEFDAQLRRTEENIATLEAALASSSGGVVKFGGDIVTPIEPTNRLSDALAGRGGGTAPSLKDSIKDVEGALDNLGQTGAFGTIRSELRGLIVEGGNWRDAWDSVIGSVADRALDPVWDALSNSLQKAVPGAAGGGPAAAGGGGFFAGLSGLIGNVLGFDDGGAFTVSGRAGTDRNLATVRLSEGEEVQVTRRGDAGRGPVINVTIQTPDPAAFKASRAQIGRQLGAVVAAGQRAS
jgi:hypothetical protein